MENNTPQDSRILLAPGSVITLKVYSEDAKKKSAPRFDDFTITKIIGVGGSSICYEAKKDDGVSGRLKEYYPVDVYEKNFSRTGDHQLVIRKFALSGDMPYKNFQLECDQLIKTYQTLQTIRDKQMEFNNFIPSFEIYRGIDDTERHNDDEKTRNGTVYVWTPNDKAITIFSDYLEKYVKPDIDKEKNAKLHLLNILNALYTLTKCIKTLSNERVKHLDLKPANFGIAQELSGFNTSNISIFDVNSITANNENARFIGTEGFYAPEMEGRPRPRSTTDLYSIGAILFHALMYANGKNEFLYHKSSYDSLPRILAGSRLLICSDDTSHSKLFDCLLSILQKCLHKDYSKRYGNNPYEQLINDLFKAIAILFPKVQLKNDKKLGETIVITKKAVQTEDQIDAKGAIQRLLLEHPLYSYGNGGCQGKILVLGSGTYAQKFLDLAFEISQIKDYSPDITVISDERNQAKSRYLTPRPAFKQFFTVDEEHRDDSYGTLRFGNDIKFDINDDEANKKWIENIFESHADGFSYVFIALGDDELNRQVAEICIHNATLSQCNAFVSFMQYKDNSDLAKKLVKSNENIDAIYVRNSIKKASYYRELRRMAFNCHILWENTLNVDLQETEQRFLSKYNFNSSFASVLSIKYKLHSMNIELENLNNHTHVAEIARRAADMTRNLSNLGELAMYEHRRWIVNLVCMGWMAPETTEYSKYPALKKATKDSVHKLHPCLVPCRSNLSLTQNGWPDNGKAMWDDAKQSTDGLDALDEVSVLLHRHFASLTTEESDLKTKIWNEIDSLLNLLHHENEVRNLMQNFANAISDSIGTLKHFRLYHTYHKKFELALPKLPETLKKEAEEKLKKIDELMFPILEAGKYTDYKSKDLAIVQNIPFILTYSFDTLLYIPFAMESGNEKNNNLLFSNVNAVLSLNPKRVTYIVDTEEVGKNGDCFNRALSFASKTMDARNMQTKINLLFLHDQKNAFPFRDPAQLQMQSERIGDVTTLEYRNDEELEKKIAQYFLALKRRLKRTTSDTYFWAIEKNGTGTARLLRGFGCYRQYPHYEINPNAYNADTRFITKKPSETEPTCEAFNYIHFEDHLLVSELFATQTISGAAQSPELPDHDVFWELYDKQDAAWKTLCEKLHNYSEQNDVLGEIVDDGAENADCTEKSSFRILLPSFCYQSARKISKALHELIPTAFPCAPSVQYHTSDSCCLTATCSQAIGDAIKALFSNPYLLCDANKLHVKMKYESHVVVSLDHLAVRDIALNDDEIRIMENLSDKGKIISYTRDDHNVSFCYASSRIKEVMTVEGKILAFHIYYDALKQNYFDDIACCYKISDQNHVFNEFSLILTKGYRTIIVECNTRKRLSQDVYHKLQNLNHQFGINSIAVMVADTRTRFGDNQEHFSRGTSYGILNVYDKEQIKDIGAVLRGFMEETSK